VQQAKRYLSEHDLFYLLTQTLNRPDICKEWLYKRCREFQRSPNGHLDLWAREHYKSTIITFGCTIMDIIRDPEITIGIFSHTKPIAKDFLRQIKREFEENELLYELWPHIFWENPRKQAPKWSEDEGIIVKRKKNPKEATIEASGLVDGQPTGKHYKLRIYDDVVTRESVNTAEQIKKTTSAWELSDNLGSHGGIVRYIGTRYHLFDTYRTMMDREVVDPRIHPCTDDGTETGNPVFLSRKDLDKKRRTQGVFTFSAQMLLNPVADAAQGFRQDWIVYGSVTYEQAMETLNRYIIVDPASKKRKDNDYTAMVVLGYGADRNWYLLDAIRDRLNLTQRAEAVIELHRKWKPHRVGYEEYGLQADIEHLEYVQKDVNYRFQVTPLGGNKLKKEDRILKLVPYFEQGRIILPPTMTYRPKDGGALVDLIKIFIEEEYVPFPVLAHDDFIDAMSRLADDELGVQEPSQSSMIEARDFTYETFASETAVSDDSWMTG
jgi:predicted phage terminase large subunit-like protein